MYLYKRDLDNCVLYWKAEFKDNQILFYYGRVDPSYKLNAPNHYCEGSFKDIQRLYRNKLKLGYSEYVNDDYDILSKANLKITTLNDVTAPMKCQSYKDIGNRYTYKKNTFAQPKYNGVRCTVIKDDLSSNNLFDDNHIKFASKNGIEYHANHLLKQLDIIIDWLQNQVCEKIVLDGELYIPKTHVAEIAGSARNIKNPLNVKLQYIIYDLAIENYSNLERNKILSTLHDEDILSFHNNNSFDAKVYLSSYKFINSASVLQYATDCVNNGYEGCVVRDPEIEYRFGHRAKTMMKVKFFDDSEFIILDIIEFGDINQKIGYGVKFICRNDINDETFEVIPACDYYQKIEYFKNKEKYIGQFATCKFYERTKNKLPFHANLITIRNYE